MKVLVKISEQNGNQVVSAKELYQKLGYNFANYKRWYDKNIINNDFAIENEDYEVFIIKTNTKGGRPARDFALTLDFAKKLSMLARTEKGEKVRSYFIEVEKKSKVNVEALTKHDILKMAIESEEARLRLLEKNTLQSTALKKQAPKVEYFNEVMQSKSTYNTNQLAKEHGFSAVTLNRMLAELNIQYKQNGTWLLYSQYQNKGYVKTKTFTYTGTGGETKTSMQTVWTERGRKFIHEVLRQQKIADNVIKNVV